MCRSLPVHLIGEIIPTTDGSKELSESRRITRPKRWVTIQILPHVQSIKMEDRFCPFSLGVLVVNLNASSMLYSAWLAHPIQNRIRRSWGASQPGAYAWQHQPIRIVLCLLLELPSGLQYGHGSWMLMRPFLYKQVLRKLSPSHLHRYCLSQPFESLCDDTENSSHWWSFDPHTTPLIAYLWAAFVDKAVPLIHHRILVRTPAQNQSHYD